MSSKEDTYKNAFLWIDLKKINIKRNPRKRGNVGFSPEKMAHLRNDIKDNGHKLPLEVRLIDGVYTLIAGERRYRSICSLYESNELCFNRLTHKIEPAQEVYSKVCCIQTSDDEKKSLVSALMENLLHVPLSDYEIIMQCQLLEEAGMSRQQQAQMLNLSEAWVSQTYSLLNPEKCNPRVLEAMASGVLGRTQALQFLNYDLDKSNVILDGAIDRWKSEETEKFQTIMKERDLLLEQWDACDDALQKAMESGNEEAISNAKKALVEAESKIDTSGKNLEKTKKNKKDKKPKPSMEQIQEAARDNDADGSAQRHMPMKTLRQYADKTAELLEQQGEIINPTTGLPCSRREIQIVLDVCNCILSRNNLRQPLDALFVSEEISVAAK